MAVVEARFDELAFPACCCSCGARAFKWRSHTDRIVLWTVLSVTRYRQVTLQVPACDACARRPWHWFGAAAAAGGLAFLDATSAANHGRELGFGFLLVVLAAIGLLLKGLAAKPLKVLALDPDDRTIRLRIRSREVARKMLAQRGHYEGEHRAVARVWWFALGFAVFPLLLLWLSTLGRHH